MNVEELIVLGVVLVFGIPLGIALFRANEICAFSVKDGAVKLVRGKAPPRLVQEVGDVVRRGGVKSGTVRIVKENQRPRVVLGGSFDDNVAQRLRNVVGTWSLAQLTRR